MTLMLPLGILFGLSWGTAALQREPEGSLPAAAIAPVPVADLVQALQVEMMSMKNTQQREFAEMKTELQHVKKENKHLQSEMIALRKVVSTYIDPQLKVNTLEIRSIEDDVQQNKEDIIDLRINDGHHDMLLNQMLNQISNMNTTLHGEIVKIDERLTTVEELGSGLQEEVGTIESDVNIIEADVTNIEVHVNTLEADVSAIETEVIAIEASVTTIDERLSKAEERTALCGYQVSMSFSASTTLDFERVYNEVDSTNGTLGVDGIFKAGIAGIYFVTLEATVGLEDSHLYGYLDTSSGDYSDDAYFIHSRNSGGGNIRDQASASRYVKLAKDETLNIRFEPSGTVAVWTVTMCVSLYSPSG